MMTGLADLGVECGGTVNPTVGRTQNCLRYTDARAL